MSNAPINSSQLQNDRFGYSCYTLVIPMPTELTAQLTRIESAAGQKRAKIPAHFTVKGTMYSIDSLDGLIAKAGEVVSRHTVFKLDLTVAEQYWSDERGSGGLAITVTPPLQDLHDELVSEIAPLGQPAYRDDPYHPHLTIVQEVDGAGLATAKKMVTELVLGPNIKVGYVDVMGRDGPALGGHWKRVGRLSLGDFK